MAETPKPAVPEFQRVTLTPEQLAVVNELTVAATQAQHVVLMTLRAILAGHHITDGRVVEVQAGPPPMIVVELSPNGRPT